LEPKTKWNQILEPTPKCNQNLYQNALKLLSLRTSVFKTILYCLYLLAGLPDVYFHTQNPNFGIFWYKLLIIQMSTSVTL
jgi:hypothetical protein